MNSSIRTNPTLPNRAIRKIRPVQLHLGAVRLGPGSGSLGEFIEISSQVALAHSKNLTAVVVISRSARCVNRKIPLTHTFCCLFALRAGTSLLIRFEQHVTGWNAL